MKFDVIVLVSLCKYLTHSGDIGLHRQQIEEGEELHSEDGVDLRGRQHQHAQ